MRLPGAWKSVQFCLIVSAAMWGTISRPNCQVCDRLHGGPMAKKLGADIMRLSETFEAFRSCLKG